PSLRRDASARRWLRHLLVFVGGQFLGASGRGAHPRRFRDGCGNHSKSVANPDKTLCLELSWKPTILRSGTALGRTACNHAYTHHASIQLRAKGTRFFPTLGFYSLNGMPPHARRLVAQGGLFRGLQLRRRLPL